ncbi:MAG: DUF362 domain-containing protein [bacterium]
MSKVFFAKDITKVDQLFDSAEIGSLIAPADPVALKIHFGEPGNTAYLKPDEVKPVFEKVKACAGKPYYTDCNTLYSGPRGKTKTHLQVAKDHGYNDVIIPEEEDFVTRDVNLKHFKKVYLGSQVAKSPVIIALTHFKGHELTGFGGTLKNLGMGFGTRLGKLKMHQDCINCAEIKSCRKNQTVEACWIGSPAMAQEKIVEYAYGAVQGKKCAYFNFIIRVSPNCDCFGHNDPPIVPDIGVLASLDPVAIDQASVDLVNQTESSLKSRNKFRALYSNVNWEIQLKYAQEIGLGSRKYELVS